MALSSRSKHLLALFGSVLLVAQTPSPVRAQQIIELSDSLLAATDELRVRFRTTSWGMSNYSFGEFFVLSREGGSQRGTGRNRGPILDRREIVGYRTSFRYAVKGRESSLRVSVSVRWSGHSEVWLPMIAFGDRIEGPEDTVEVVDSMSAKVVFEEDTAAAWTVTMVERSGAEVPDRYSFVGTITSGARTILLVPVRSAPAPRRRGLRGLLSNSVADGYVLEEEGRAIAAVQFWGTGMSAPADKRVWMPKSATARERLEFAAIFTAVLRAASIPPEPAKAPNP